MEKEKKGLFGRLLDFWKEKISMSGMDRIGFWHEKKTMENPFAEMGTVAALSQRETRKAFWEEAAAEAEKTVLAEGVWEKQKRALHAEVAEEENADRKTLEEGTRGTIFSAELLRERGQAEKKETGMRQAFFSEETGEEREKRSIVPVPAEAMQEEKIYAGEEEKIPVNEIHKKEKTQTESVIDIERLMQQMTKKLWEERESCGRRLR